MSGRGKGGKRLGKGGANWHRVALYDNLQGITKPATHCVARRGRVKWVSCLIYEEASVENAIRDAVIFTEHAKSKMATTMDVVYIVKCQRHTLYG
ncbi:histone H4 type VIII-like [Rhinoraja longicauda]